MGQDRHIAEVAGIMWTDPDYRHDLSDSSSCAGSVDLPAEYQYSEHVQQPRTGGYLVAALLRRSDTRASIWQALGLLLFHLFVYAPGYQALFGIPDWRILPGIRSLRDRSGVGAALWQSRSK